MTSASCLAMGIHMDNQDLDDNVVAANESCEIGGIQKNVIGFGAIVLVSL